MYNMWKVSYRRDKGHPYRREKKPTLFNDKEDTNDTQSINAVKIDYDDELQYDSRSTRECIHGD